MLFKKSVNDAVRAGHDEIERSRKTRRYSLTLVKGQPRRTDLDNVAEVIAEVEGERFK